MPAYVHTKTIHLQQLTNWQTQRTDRRFCVDPLTAPVLPASLGILANSVMSSWERPSVKTSPMRGMLRLAGRAPSASEKLFSSMCFRARPVIVPFSMYSTCTATERSGQVFVRINPPGRHPLVCEPPFSRVWHFVQRHLGFLKPEVTIFGGGSRGRSSTSTLAPPSGPAVYRSMTLTEVRDVMSRSFSLYFPVGGSWNKMWCGLRIGLKLIFELCNDN